MPRVLASLLLALAACTHSSPPPAQPPPAQPPPAQPPTNLSSAQPAADAPSTPPLRYSGMVHHAAIAVMPDEGLHQGNAPGAADLKIGLLRDAATFERFVTKATVIRRDVDVDVDVDFDASLVIAVVLDRDGTEFSFADTTIDAGTATVTIEVEDVPPPRANVRPAVLASVPRAGQTTVIVKLATGETIGSIAVR